MEPQAGPGLDEVLMAARRRATFAAVVFAIGSVLALLVAQGLPPVYSATAKILVESQKIPDELARSTVTAPAAERLELIEQRLMTRTNLLEIAGALGLFADRPDLSPAERVEALREGTAIEPIAIGRRGSGVAAFTITYRAADPAEAAAVANEFVTRVLEQNLEQRATRAAGTNAFFKAEIERLRAEIAETERRIGASGGESEDRQPDARTVWQAELLALQERRAERERRRIALEAQKRRLSERVRPAAAEAGAAPAGTEGEAERQIGRLDTRLALLARGDAADGRREATVEAALEAARTADLALARLHRHNEDLEEQRRVAVQKQAEAEIGERLELDHQAERFEVIEHAGVPAEPEAPNRGLIAAGGTAASLALGLALALLAEMTDRAVHGPSDLERRTGFRPVVTVPWIAIPAERRRRRRRAVAGFAALAVGLPLLLGAVDRQVMPLPVLTDRLMSTTGLDGFVRAAQWRLGG